MVTPPTELSPPYTDEDLAAIEGEHPSALVLSLVAEIRRLLILAATPTEGDAVRAQVMLCDDLSSRDQVDTIKAAVLWATGEDSMLTPRYRDLLGLNQIRDSALFKMRLDLLKSF